MEFRFPVFLDLTGKKCLVTGEGFEVAGKVQALVDAGAHVTYVNPTAEEAIRQLAASGAVRWIQRDFEPGDLDGCFLVITDREDNSDVFRLAEQQRVLCNAVDDPPHCRFSFPTVHRQGDLTIAVSTNGCAPAMAVRLKQRFQRDVGPEYGELLAMLKRIRPEISERIAGFEARRELWYRIVDSSALEFIRSGERDKAQSAIRDLIEAAVSSTSHSRTSGDSVDL